MDRFTRPVTRPRRLRWSSAAAVLLGAAIGLAVAASREFTWLDRQAQRTLTFVERQLGCSCR